MAGTQELNITLASSANGKPRVMVVDDEEPIRRMLGGVLRKLGCGVDTACCATEAIRQLGQVEYRLVLVDVVMPGVDGITLVQQIRERWPRTRIVVMSGKAQHEMVGRAFRNGAADFLCKPIDGEQLRHMLSRYAFD